MTENHPPTIANVPADALNQPRRLVVGRWRWGAALAAFEHRNFRLFYYGQGISLIGTWMHSVALGWFVYQLTNSPFALGFVNFLNALPTSLLMLYAGVTADRFDKRRILVRAQTAAMLLALLLAALAWSGYARLWQIAAIGMALGTVMAFDVPTRQSFVVELVGRENLTNAIALNSAMFNTARILGPALAGLLIGVIGVAGCFFLNGLSYIAVIIGYRRMNLPPHQPPAARQPVWHETREALRHLAGDAALRRLVGLVAVFGLCGFQYVTLLPVFARDVLGGSARTLGFLTAANGLGALCGALTLALAGNRWPAQRVVPLCLALYAVALGAFGFSNRFWTSALALAVVGYNFPLAMASANSFVQLHSPDRLRGRLMSMYLLAFLGTGPLGNLLIGTAARWFGAPVAVLGCAGLCLLAVLFHVSRSSATPPTSPGQTAAPSPDQSRAR